jgi:hypothetical protein
MGRKTEVFVVEGAELHDTVDVRRAVGAVGRSAEAEVDAVLELELELEPVSEWERRQGGLN